MKRQKSLFIFVLKMCQKRLYIYFVGIMIIAGNSFSQQIKVGTTVDFKKRDFFLNWNTFIELQEHQIGVGAGVGLTRAIVQNRLLCQFSANYAYCFVQKTNFQLMANNTFSYGTMLLSKTSHQRLHLVEELVGLSYEVGKRWRFKNTILGGFYSEIIQPKPAFSLQKIGIGYQFTIGVLYAI